MKPFYLHNIKHQYRQIFIHLRWVPNLWEHWSEVNETIAVIATIHYQPWLVIKSVTRILTSYRNRILHSIKHGYWTIKTVLRNSTNNDYYFDKLSTSSTQQDNILNDKPAVKPIVANVPNFYIFDCKTESFTNYKHQFDNYVQIQNIESNKGYCAKL